MKQIILHIPHASRFIPDYSGYLADNESLFREMVLLTDWHTYTTRSLFV